MVSIPATLSVERQPASARSRAIARLLFFLMALCVPLLAQEPSGEASLKLPPLDSVTFLNGVSGGSLLMSGIVVSILGMIFGLIIFMRLRGMPVHGSMRDVSELIYETCKTY